MKTHFTHRFSKTAHLELMEYAPNDFHVCYLTMEGYDEEGREEWYANNSDVYTSFSEAKAGFNKRRSSTEPFIALTR